MGFQVDIGLSLFVFILISKFFLPVVLYVIPLPLDLPTGLQNCSSSGLLPSLTIYYTFLLAWLFFPFTELSTLQTRITGFTWFFVFVFVFFPSSSFLEKAHLLQVCNYRLFFFFVNDLPTDPQPHQVPHFFLFSDGDTLCLPSQLKRINTQVSISSQGLSSLTDRTLLNCTNSVESSLHSLLSPRSLFFFFFSITLNQLPDSTVVSSALSWRDLLLPLSAADRYLNQSFQSLTKLALIFVHATCSQSPVLFCFVFLISITISTHFTLHFLPVFLSLCTQLCFICTWFGDLPPIQSASIFCLLHTPLLYNPVERIFNPL